MHYLYPLIFSCKYIMKNGRQCNSNRQLCALNVDFATSKAHTYDYWYTVDHWVIHVMIEIIFFFSISLRACETLWSAREMAPPFSAERERRTENVFHMLLRSSRLVPDYNFVIYYQCLNIRSYNNVWCMKKIENLWRRVFLTHHSEFSGIKSFDFLWN